MDAIELLTDIIDYFATAKETPGDWWAHDDQFESYNLDHQSRDGTKLWIDLEKNGTIKILWLRAGMDEPIIMRFRA